MAARVLVTLTNRLAKDCNKTGADRKGGYNLVEERQKYYGQRVTKAEERRAVVTQNEEYSSNRNGTLP